MEAAQAGGPRIRKPHSALDRPPRDLGLLVVLKLTAPGLLITGRAIGPGLLGG